MTPITGCSNNDCFKSQGNAHSGKALFAAIRQGNIAGFSLDKDALQYEDSGDGLPIHIAASLGNEVIIKALLEAMQLQGISVDIKDRNGCTALMWASSNGCTEATRLLLQAGAHVGYVDKEGRSALYFAASFSRIDALELLISAAHQQGVSLDSPNNKGATLLIIASAYGYHTCAAVLVQAGADVSCLCNRGVSALYRAAQNGHERVIEVLAPAMRLKGLSLDDGDALMVAAGQGRLGAAKALLAAGAAVDYLDCYDFSALFYAAKYDQKKVAELLIDNGASVALVSKKGETALLQSRKSGHKAFYKWMKKKDERTFEYSRELRQRKLLAHILAIDGQTELLHPDKNQQKQIAVQLKGWDCNDIWKVILKRAQSFFKDLPDMLLACESAADVYSSFSLEYLYHSKGPIIINIGHNNHHVAAIFWDSYFIICNRGNSSNRSSCEVLPLDSKIVDSTLITELCSLQDKTAEEYIAYLNKKFPSRLSAATPGSIEALLERYLSLPEQEMGNCAWANSEAAIYALLFLRELPKGRCPTAEELEKIAVKQKQLFENWRSFMMDTQVERYLRGPKTVTSVTHLYPRDWELLNRVKAKAPAFIAEKIDRFSVAARDMLSVFMNNYPDWKRWMSFFKAPLSIEK